MMKKLKPTPLRSVESVETRAKPAAKLAAKKPRRTTPVKAKAAAGGRDPNGVDHARHEIDKPVSAPIPELLPEVFAPPVIDAELGPGVLTETRASSLHEAGEVGEAIRALEERLDRMIQESKKRPPVPPAPTSTTRLPDAEGDGTVFDTARELLSTDFYLRKWGRLGMRNRSEEVDDFGFDPIYEAKVRPLLNFLYERYFRVECVGIEHVPDAGRCLLVANHSGTLPIDGAMIKTAVKRKHPQQRDVRWLAEDFIFHFPFLGSITNRVGAVRACQENAERLLRQEALVAVFPEGVKGIGKLYKDRYRLQRFGRGGFIKLCLRTSTPIVPVAVIGAEETNPMLLRIEYLSKALGLPYLPVTPTFPLLGPIGLAPAPTKWKIVFGEIVRLDSHGPEAAEDDILVGRLAERVRATIQGMLDRGIGERRSVFFG